MSVETEFQAQTLATASLLIERATGIKIESDVDLTYMDGDDWPPVLPGEFVIGEMLPSELGLMKAQVETGLEQQKVDRELMGHALRIRGEAILRGETEGLSVDVLPKDLRMCHSMLSDAVSIVNDLLYFGLKTRFNRHGDDTLAVRRGGKVVSSIKEDTTK